MFLVSWGGVPGFWEVLRVLGRSGVFRDVPMFRVPVFLEVLHAVLVRKVEHCL